MFYDLCVRTEDLRNTLGTARKLGWQGLGILIPYSVSYMRELGELREEVKNLDAGIDVGFGVEINARDPNEARRVAKIVRKDAELVVVRGGKPEVERTVLETPEVDVLLHDADTRLNHVLAKLAARNNVAVGFVFSSLLLSYKRTRISVFSNMISSARLLRKYRSPVILSSGSMSPWDLRSPSDLLAFGRLLGFQDNQAAVAMSDRMLKENRKRLGKKWVMPGVEIE